MREVRRRHPPPGRVAAPFALVLALVCCAGGCASHPPERFADLPEVQARARRAIAPLPLKVAVVPVQSDPSPGGDPSREGEAAAHATLDDAALTAELVDALRSQKVFREVVRVGADGDVERAYAEGADLVLRLRVKRAVVRFSGLNKGVYALNWVNWMLLWVTSWWVADERYALEVDASIELTGVRSQSDLFWRDARARVERSMDDFDRGLTFLGLPYLPGSLDQDNLRQAARVLAPYARNRVLWAALHRLDEDFRPMVTRGELARDDASELALLVGVSRYDHYTVRDIRFASDDARLMRMALLDDRRSPPVPPKNVRTLIDERATGREIEAALDRLLSLARPNDRVVVYFAGYAAPTAAGDALLLPHDFDPERAGAGVSLQGLVARLARSRAGAGLVVLDAALAGGAEGRAYELDGGVGAGAGAVRSLAEAARPAMDGGRVCVVTAGGDGQGAHVLEQAGHGLFTYHLLHALRGGASGDAEPRPWSEALRQAREEVRKHATLEAVPQSPQIEGDPGVLDGGGAPSR
jgi:hypothetical protein